MRPFSAFALAAFAVLTAEAVAAPPTPVFTDAVTVNTKQVPLPPGEWLLAGRGLEGADPSFGAFGAIENLILLQVDMRKQVTGVVEINSNVLPVADGWGLSTECGRSDLYLTTVRYRSGWDGACQFVKPNLMRSGLDAPKAWREARDFAARQGYALPPGWLTVGTRVADRQDVLDVRYHVDPQAHGLGPVAPHTAADWRSEAVLRNPGRLGLVERLSLWSIWAGDHIEKGLRTRHADALPALPTAQAVSRRPDAAQRLQMLDELRAESRIDAEHYKQQREILLAERDQNASGWLSHSFKKNVSFRVFGSIVDWFLAFGVTLSGPVSTGITASIVGIHSVIFVLNDRYWDKYWAERGRKDGSRTVDFGYAMGDL